MKRKILTILLAGTLVLQSGVWALAEELIVADEGVFYELEECAEAISEEDTIGDVSDESIEPVQEDTADAYESLELPQENTPNVDESVMLEEELEPQENCAELDTFDGVSEQETNELDETDAESNLQAEELLVLDEIVIEDIAVVDTVEYAATATAASGTCGTSVTWQLDSSANLVISGTGKMDDYGSYQSTNPAPWLAYLDDDTLNSVTVNSGVTRIGTYAFNECGINNIQLPDTLVEIGERAFSGCNNLAQVIIPDSVTTLEDYAFYGTDLVSVSVPDSVTTFGAGVFSECFILESVKLPANMTEIPEKTFFFGRALTEIEIPSGVTKIGDNAFNQCKSLTEITLPKGLTTIGAGTFANCANIREISIPASVTSIGDEAFRYMSYYDGKDYGDVTFYFMGDIPKFGSEVFTGVHGNLYYLGASADT